MMKSSEQIQLALSKCKRNSCSKECPYHGEGACYVKMLLEAGILIRQLERERDAAVKAMKYMAKDLDVGICCETCSHYAYDEEDESSICADCDVDSNWQWRGIWGME